MQLFSRLRVWAAVVVVLVSEVARAEVKPAALFGDNMVLQQGMPVPVWGTAAAGEKVVVSMEGQTQTAQADANGKWMVRLGALAAGGPFELRVNDSVIKNVLVGEVWLASGQSNMAFTVAKAQNASDEIAAANFPEIRSFTVRGAATAEPQNETAGKWEVCSPATVGHFSAAAYFYARELQQSLHVPVGIIHASRGGTPAEAWTSRAALESQPVLKPRLDFWDKRVADYPGLKKQYDAETLPAWQAAADKAKADGKAAPLQPAEPSGYPGDPHVPASLYNGMIAPLIPYGMKGVIWYQGEANNRLADEYRTLFPTLINDWRQRWAEGNFPFLWVQLANNGQKQTQPSEGDWAEIRDAQRLTLSLPNTAMAVITDTSADGNLHPPEKQPVGHRLALAALATVYGQKIEASGPLYDSMKIEGGSIRIRFTHVEGGLELKGGPPSGFAIAGADRKWVWADAKIDGETVVVSSPTVTAPVAVRYGWASNPFVTLYNKAGLPASSFRTDSDSTTPHD